MKRFEINNSVRKIASVINYLYDEKVSYHLALRNCKIPSGIRKSIPPAPEYIVGCIKSGSREA